MLSGGLSGRLSKGRLVGDRPKPTRIVDWTVSKAANSRLQLAPGTEVKEYRLVRVLGRGGFGEVWEAIAPGGVPKAIKFAAMENENGEMYSRELEGLKKIRSIRHPFLLSIEWYDILDGYLVIGMELADKSLVDRLQECVDQGQRGLPRDELLQYMREAAEVLDLLSEQHGLQHLDIKPGNLFLSSGHIKVADFGLVQPRNTSIQGAALAFSPPYAPPELFDGRIEPSADLYALAVTYQELLTGARPYSAVEVRALIFQHIQGRPDLSQLPASDRPIVQQAISREVSQRFPSCRAFVEALTRAVSYGAPTINLGKLKKPELPNAGVNTQRMTPPSTVGSPSNNARPMFVRNQSMPSNQGPAKPVVTQPKTQIVSRAVATITAAPSAVLSSEANASGVRETFLAFLPLEIFAHKLRGFIDAMEAEMVKCTDEKTVLLFRSKGFLGFRSQKGLFLQVDACSLSPNSGFRVVDVAVWTSNPSTQPEELARKGRSLIGYLRGFLMADDKPRSLRSIQQMKDEIFG